MKSPIAFPIHALAGAAILVLGSGCASTEKMRSYEDEIVTLREEKTKLRKENQDLKRRLGDYEMRLAEANMKLLETPTLPELDNVGVTYGARDGNLVITLPNDITFSSGQATLTTRGKTALKAVASTIIDKYPGEAYFIEGHTDTDPIRKSKFESNRDLSVARAMEVHAFLVEECSIPDQDCVVAGYGEYRPVADNATKAGKSQNRRVEIVVHLAG